MSNQIELEPDGKKKEPEATPFGSPKLSVRVLQVSKSINWA